MAGNFADRLMAAIKKKNSRVCVGIDPVFGHLPPHLLLAETEGGGWYNEGHVLNVVQTFCKAIIDSIAERAVAVKFNSAFFEEVAPGGTAVLDDLLDQAVGLKLLTILDAKRGDIGSTAESYARGALRQPPKAPVGGFRRRSGVPRQPPDAVTVNPYLGSDGVLPFVHQAAELDAGVFVLVKTSNPSAEELQELEVEGKPIYVHVAELVDRWGEGLVGEWGYSSVGAVVGATYPAQLGELRGAMPQAPFLVPGYGAQGGGPEDVVGAFDENGLGAIINSSRGIIYAYAASPYAQRPGVCRSQGVLSAEGRNARGHSPHRQRLRRHNRRPPSVGRCG